MKSYLSPVVALLGSVTLLAAAACSAGSGSSSGSSSPGADQSLAIGLVAEPASLDFTTTDGAAIPQALLGNVYNGLVKQDESGKIVPDLAKSWTISPDRKTYVFTLVDNAKFTNGQPFTADDAVFSIERVKTAWTTSLKSAMDVVQTAKAVSPTELQVTLTKPSNDWLFRMTTRIGAMFSKTGVDKLATEPIGTGPYKFGSWKRGDSIVLQRNDAYWGTKPHFGQVTLKYFKDPTALNNALLTGTINVIGTVQAPEALSQFTSNDKYQVIEGTTNGEVLLSFNNSRPVLSDIRVRSAIRAAIDHKALVETCWAGRGKLIGSMVPPTDPWYEDLTSVTPYDLPKAKSLLQAAGATGKTLRLRLPTLPYATSCGQVVKSQLEQAGLKVQIDQLEFPAAWLTAVLKNADYDMSIIAHVEPRDLGAVFNAKYYTRYDDPTLQQALAAADAGDEATQVSEMKKAARRLSEQAAADWLFLIPNLMVADKDLKGLPKNAITESLDLSTLSR
ncbi:peptide ABC transporter substrate-binding protein [Kribbella sp. ALI-6-A]|uniref:ABC transporter substrate-binding protein n=1 Tax=Kribbella sp. ALI-6-A TaxID=1933817 RepID=UPI00097C543B|nr:ABC transporter substrate-binding protein [Kribbella sp. ALI-6-A]ONI74462.1 peptide ABC transporter substrate-binding protein [Kribbella sp. ALI-6-A]